MKNNARTSATDRVGQPLLYSSRYLLRLISQCRRINILLLLFFSLLLLLLLFGPLPF